MLPELAWLVKRLAPPACLPGWCHGGQVHHLVELGINTVELLPIHEFDEFEFQRQVNPRNHMVSSGWCAPCKTMYKSFETKCPVN